MLVGLTGLTFLAITESISLPIDLFIYPSFDIMITCHFYPSMYHWSFLARWLLCIYQSNFTMYDHIGEYVNMKTLEGSLDLTSGLNKLLHTNVIYKHYTRYRSR